MSHMRFADEFKPVTLDQFDNSLKTSPHIGGQGIEFSANAVIEQFNDPTPSLPILAFLQYQRALY